MYHQDGLRTKIDVTIMGPWPFKTLRQKLQSLKTTNQYENV